MNTYTNHLKINVLRFFSALFLTALVFIILSLFFVSSFAQNNSEGSLYEKWISQVFVQPPQGDSVFDVSMENPTVKRAHTLVDENGETVVIASNNNDRKYVFIGDYSPHYASDTLNIRGEDAKLTLKSSSGDEKIILGDFEGNSASLEFRSADNALVLKNKEDAIVISSDKTEFPVALKKGEDPVVSAFTCDADFLLQGFDEDAEPICVDGSTASSASLNVVWVSVHTTGVCSQKCGGGIMEYKSLCRGGDDYSIIYDDAVCIEKGLPKPSHFRRCNVFECQE